MIFSPYSCAVAASCCYCAWSSFSYTTETTPSVAAAKGGTGAGCGEKEESVPVRHWLFTCALAYVIVHHCLWSHVIVYLFDFTFDKLSAFHHWFFTSALAYVIVRPCLWSHVIVYLFDFTFDKLSALHHWLFTCALAYVIVHLLLEVYAHVLVSTCEYLRFWLSLDTNDLLHFLDLSISIYVCMLCVFTCALAYVIVHPLLVVYAHVLFSTCEYLHFLPSFLIVTPHEWPALLFRHMYFYLLCLLFGVRDPTSTTVSG